MKTAIQNAQIIIGDGRVIPSGAILFDETGILAVGEGPGRDLQQGATCRMTPLADQQNLAVIGERDHADRAVVVDNLARGLAAVRQAHRVHHNAQDLAPEDVLGSQQDFLKFSVTFHARVVGFRGRESLREG